MKYYATVKHHSTISYWERIEGAKTLSGAKRIATRDYGKGYRGHVINVVEIPDDFKGHLNDIPAHTKIIGSDKWINEA